MADVKWIKITTDIFDDEKIKIIDTMPARDEILVIWFKLLALTGRTNQGGSLVMNNKIPYTNKMLSAVFNRSLNIVQLSLGVFQDYGMIEIEDNETIVITNWDKHQNIEGLDKIREQNKNRQQLARDKKKLLQIEDNHVTRHVTVTDNNATDIELDLELDKEKEKDISIKEIDEKIPYKEIITYLNEQANKNFKFTGSKTKELINGRYSDGFTKEDFIKVIDIKCNEWLGNKDMEKFLQPSTLFSISKFEGYLNQEVILKGKKTNTWGNIDA
ncbi:phage replisome organizer N-terminal domain-containing protein [Clostridium sp.]